MRNCVGVFLVAILCYAPAAWARQWTDRTGEFTIDAKFVSLKDGKVYLEKPDGSVIGVPVERLSSADHQFLESLPETKEYLKQNPLPDAAADPSTAIQFAKISAPADFKFGEVRRFPKMGWGVESLAFSPDGGRLAAGKMDRALILFDVDKARPLTSLEKLEELGQVTCVQFTPDGTKLLAAGSTGRILVWEVDGQGRMKPYAQFVGHNGAVHCIAISRDGRYVVSGSGDKSLRYWKLENGQEIQGFEEFKGGVKACFITPNGHQALGCDGESLILFDLVAGKSIQQMKLGSYVAQDVEISPDGRRVIVSDSYDIRMWNILDGIEYPRLKDREIQWSTIFSPDGKYVLSGASQKANLWSVKTYRRIQTFDTAGSGYVKALAFSPDKRHIAVCPGNAGQDLQVFRLPAMEE